MALASDRPLLLLVEDHEDTRRMYAEFLSTSFDVMEAADARQALDAMRAQTPALVITDFKLPGIDGFELIKQMRVNESTRGVPTICLSGYSGNRHEQRAREVGCDRVLVKPCLPDLLYQTAQDMIRSGRLPVS
ncbi:MAG TPA: response regulator [Vicinamibacterales bacterium]|jgi:CheY-like chemotaxis protein